VPAPAPVPPPPRAPPPVPVDEIEEPPNDEIEETPPPPSSSPPPVPLPSKLAPIVRCRVDGPPGRRFVRVLHAAPSIEFRVNHAVMVTDEAGDDDRATMTTRFAITTPSWASQRAHVALHDRAPGGEHAPRVITHGTIVLDGGTAMLVNPERTVHAHVRTVYDGAIRDPAVPATDPIWGRDSRRAIYTVLDLPDPMLPAGPFDVRVTSATTPARDVVVTAADAEKIGAVLRLPLWADTTLHGSRRNAPETFSRRGARMMVQRLVTSVTNASEVSRDVWIEERLRPAKKRDIRGEHPKLTITDGVARMQVVVPPRGTQQVTLTITYEL
jgi:hypothetical protein